MESHYSTSKKKDFETGKGCGYMAEYIFNIWGLWVQPPYPKYIYLLIIIDKFRWE
jgi:hypothetical protein